ncbi:ABC transporter substrate-binding protein [Xylanimonas oleitrophica]|uniref:ABC transporter substrate-binding protein n=1 Tax=Xylanimonas oleitrophica TaxID=2607479 RepID=A0A2W5Y536_9MICO|nr:ABC transporter substrate-binding protein [Xylanimonas oleitrophica]PZR53134.1 ABC transporter substrate-binding protein [Xylanimonas oleitrophica]
MLTTALAGCGAAQGSAPQTAADAQGYPLTYTSCGTEVTVDGPPQRAVSLNQSATEIMLRLGLADRIAGTAYETDPVPEDIADEYAGIDLLTDGLLKHETLLEAQPDFVYSSFASFLTTENAGSRDELHRLGIPTYLTEFDCTYHEAVEGGATFDMLFDEITDIGRIFDVEAAAERLVEEQRSIIEAGLETAENIEGTPRIVWFYSTAASSATPSVAGPGGLPQTVTEMLGAENVFADASTKWPEVSWDEVAVRDPDVIVLADLTRGYPGDTAQEKIDFLKNDPLTSTMDAVREDRFIVVPGQYMDPSVHSVQAVPTVAQGLVSLADQR